MAVRNDEVSEVNEMLQGMERFDGVFVCTTNLLDRIDEAALRLLSPGDFATVQRQVVLLEETLEPVEFLAQLEQEHGIKPDVRFEKPIGFVH